MFRILLLLFVVQFTSACQPVARSLIGIRDFRTFDAEELQNWSEKMNLGDYNIYKLDTGYLDFVESEFQNDTHQHDLLQPIQVYCFDSTGTLLSFSNNCNYPGVRTKWNIIHSFDTFPFLNRAGAEILDKFTLEHILSFTSLVINRQSVLSGRNSLVIFVNNTLYRNSKSLIEVIDLEKYPDTNIMIINNDDFMYHNYEL